MFSGLIHFKDFDFNVSFADFSDPYISSDETISDDEPDVSEKLSALIVEKSATNKLNMSRNNGMHRNCITT